ncbi:MAG: MerR family transcriptional regulator [Geobacteraceae bacterium]|nr:MerR family transcriptional regulator [Geobacteraceae bacterium]
MTLGKSWCSIGEASAKYSLDKSLIQKWVDEGLIRTEEDSNKMIQLNLDDLELEVKERVELFKK